MRDDVKSTIARIPYSTIRRNRRFNRFLLSVLSSTSILGYGTLAGSGMAWAGPVDWTGTTSGDWNTSTNWSTSTVPTAGDTVTIDLSGSTAALVDATSATAGGLYVGVNGTAAGLGIINGGTLTTDYGTIGVDPGSYGSVAVNGTGSKWNLGGSDLTIGDGGNGLLTISQNGRVASQNGFIGNSSGGYGRVDVSVSGAWTNAGDLYVGNDGSGLLNISDGLVTNDMGRLGNVAGSAGFVNVDGAGSSWKNSHAVIIGVDGAGTLTITNGGRVTSTDGTIAEGTAATGNVTVDGQNSRWTIGGVLDAGHLGDATLSILNGGTVTATSYALIGRHQGSQGAVTVAGSDSSLYVGDFLSVGNAGGGRLAIQSGGRVDNQDAFVAATLGASGLVIVTGANSIWNTQGQLYVGYGDYGRVTISSGGTVNSGDSVVGFAAGREGNVVVNGVGSRWDSSTLVVGQAGTGSLTLSDSGSLSSNIVILGNGAGSIGLATVDGPGSQLNAGTGNAIVLGASLIVGSSGNGYLTVSNGSSVNTNGWVLIAENSGSFGTLNIGSDLSNPSATEASGRVNAQHVTFGAGTGVINFNHISSNYSFGSEISGFGTINQAGGKTILTADSSGFTGATNVSGGTLAVNGKLGGTMDVLTGGRLQGIGTIGDTSISGTIAPGNSIGTIKASNIAFTPGSIYEVEVNAKGQGDKILASGTAMINGGSVNVLAGMGLYAPQTRYVILTANGGLTGQGTFDGVSSNLAFLTPSLSYDPNNVYLTLISSGTGFADVARTRNQRAVATGAEALGGGNAVYNQILGMDVASAQSAYDSLSGEVHAAAGGQLLRDAHYVGDAVIGRLQQADRLSGDTAAREIAYLTPAEITTAAGSADTLAIWGQAFGGWSAVDSDGNAGALDRTLAGFLMGIDGQVAEDWRLGVAAGYSRSDLDLSARNSTASIDGYHVALYGGGHVGPVALRLGASYSFNNIDSQRDVTVGSLSDHDKASYQARTAQVFGEVGYDLKLGPVALEPFAGMAYVNLDTDGFKEKGGASALHGKGQNQDMPYSTLGLRVAGEIAKLGGGSLTAHGMLGWRHAYGDVTPTADLSFGGGSSAFTVAGTPIARDALVAQAGLDLNITDRLTVGLAYDGQIAGNAQDNAVHGSFTWKF